MNRCPKCGSWNIIGPKYHRLGWGGEALRYTCAPCGYSQDEPTRDAKENANRFAEQMAAGYKRIFGS